MKNYNIFSRKFSTYNHVWYIVLYDLKMYMIIFKK